MCSIQIASSGADKRRIPTGSGFHRRTTRKILSDVASKASDRATGAEHNGGYVGHGGRFPNITGREMTKILQHLCGDPVRQRGSHKIFERRLDDRTFRVTFSYHDQATVTGGIVRQMLQNDLGLTPAEARKAVKKK